MDVLIKATKEPLSLTLCIGDYTRVQCDTLVNYILPGASDDLFKLTFHNKGRDDGDDFEKEVKASLSQKELQPWSVYKISSNTLPCSELIFIVLPAWQGNYDKALSSRINQVLVEAMQAASNSTNVAFASFSAAPFNYPVDFCAHRMISFLTDAASVSLSEDQSRGTCAVTIFTDNTECEPMFKEQLYSFGFHCEQPLSKQQQHNNNQPQVITLEGPDYKAFLNQLYDDIHVSVSYVYAHMIILCTVRQEIFDVLSCIWKAMAQSDCQVVALKIIISKFISLSLYMLCILHAEFTIMHAVF